MQICLLMIYTPRYFLQSLTILLLFQWNQWRREWSHYGCAKKTLRSWKWSGGERSGRYAWSRWSTRTRCSPWRSWTSGRCWRGRRQRASRRSGTFLCSGTGGGSPTSTTPSKTPQTWWVQKPLSHKSSINHSHLITGDRKIFAPAVKMGKSRFKLVRDCILSLRDMLLEAIASYVKPRGLSCELEKSAIMAPIYVRSCIAWSQIYVAALQLIK